MKAQSTNSILMIRPVKFGYNAQTAVNNYYQQAPSGEGDDAQSIQRKAQGEFDNMVELLRSKRVEVIVVEDTMEPHTPDSIFPNNWVSFHQNRKVALYPMYAENRRLERREDILELLDSKGYQIDEMVDFSSAEAEEVYLEGTGSMILDRVNEKAYCALSPRADEELFIEFCEEFEYFPVVFNAYQTVEGKREAIYHTNVMMCVADTFAVICLASIDQKKERKAVLQSLLEDNKEVISISEEQVNQFAGNMLQVKDAQGKTYLVMSSAAYNSLTKEQIESIEKHCEILHSPLTTIEKYGGGSARCMMAEVFLPKTNLSLA